MREPPANLVMKHADGGGSGESLVVGGVAVVAEVSAAMEKKGANEVFLDLIQWTRESQAYMWSALRLRG